MPTLDLIAVVVAALLGGFVQSTAGFGAGLIAMPMLTLAMPVTTAAPTQSLLGFWLALLILRRDFAALDRREAAWLVGCAVPAVPFGVYVLTNAPHAFIESAMGTLLLGYALWSLPQAGAFVAAGFGTRPGLATRIARAAAGLCSGLLGGAFSTAGPPLIVYGIARGWPKETFRAVLQVCFLGIGLTVLAFQSGAGLMTPRVGLNLLVGMPAIALGVFAARHIDLRLHPALFRRLVLYLIALLGTSLAVRALLH